MGRLSTWFSGLTTGMKVLVVVASLTLFAALSPLVALVATLFFVVCIPVVVCRMLRGRLFRRPGILLVGSLAVVLLANGVSDALYGPPRSRRVRPPLLRHKPNGRKHARLSEGHTPRLELTRG